jgi:hypothetical protein
MCVLAVQLLRQLQLRKFAAHIHAKAKGISDRAASKGCLRRPRWLTRLHAGAARTTRECWLWRATQRPQPCESCMRDRKLP